MKFTKELCYYLGFIWADGYVRDYYIELEILESDGLQILETLQKTDLKFFSSTRLRKNRTKRVMTIRHHSISTIRELSHYDYSIKTNSEPSKILNIIPEELKRYFYLGYSDGDGCFYISKNKITKQYTIASNYDQNWNHMASLYNSLGIKYSIQRVIRSNGEYSAIRIVNRRGLQVIYNYLYPIGFEFGLRRKFDKCLEIINQPILNVRKIIV
jgi:hypothetical protein